MTTNFFKSLSFVAVLGSGIRDPESRMGKNQDLGSGIREKHPGSATLLLSVNINLFIDNIVPVGVLERS
jgi:hypothetical protein